MDDDVQEAINGLTEENSSLKDQIAALKDQLTALQGSVSQTTDAYKTRFETIERYVRDLATALNNTPPLVIGSDTLPGVKIPIPAPPW